MSIVRWHKGDDTAQSPSEEEAMGALQQQLDWYELRAIEMMDDQMEFEDVYDDLVPSWSTGTGDEPTDDEEGKE